MPAIQIKRGLDIPLPGALVSPDIADAPQAARVALLPQESPGIKVQILAPEGEDVLLGQPLYCDRRDPDALYCAPAAGAVQAVNRGLRRAVLSVVVTASDSDQQVDFPTLDASCDRASFAAALAKSGFWPCLRQRPFERVAHTSDTPRSLFVTAMDTNPNAPAPQQILAGREAHFRAGLELLAKLPEGKTFVCTAAGEDWSAWLPSGVEQQAFRGPHPAGNAGVHIHHLDPVGPGRMVWHIGYQDVADIGEAFSTGRIPTERRVAITGPAAQDCRIARTRRGADTQIFASHAPTGGRTRTISGSALGGATAQPGTETGYLGRYANQITMLDDDPQSELLGWTVPIGKRWSLGNTYLAKFLRPKTLKFDTDINGSLRAIVPIGAYEKVMPMDILPTQLIKSLVADDLEGSEKLGVLELAEEDLALCQFVCPSKIDITDMLRAMLTRIEKEG